MALWKLDQGSSGAWDAAIVDGNGDPIAYSGDEELSGSVWPGGTRPSLLTLTPKWSAEPWLGTTFVEITEAESAALPPATYRVKLTVVDPDGLTTYYHGQLKIVASPGSGIDLPVYCEFSDLVDEIPWIEYLQGDNDTAGFLLQRAKAREWTDGLIQRHYRGGSGLSPDFYFSWDRDCRNGATSPVLQGWLDAGGLKLTPAIVEANTCYAIARILDNQIARGGENQYRTLARELYARAETAILMTTAEIDTTGAAYVSTKVAVKMDSVDTLEG